MKEAVAFSEALIPVMSHKMQAIAMPVSVSVVAKIIGFAWQCGKVRVIS